MEHASPKFNWKAVLAGAATDFACTFTTSILLAVVLMGAMAAQGQNLQGMATNAENFNYNLPLALAGLTFGLCSTALGGFVAAQIARGAELSNAGAVGVIAILMGAVMLPLDQSPIAWTSYLSFALSVPAALLGGWVRLRLPRREPFREDIGDDHSPLPHP